MAYAPRVQRDQHTLTFACWCGATSRHRMTPTTWRIRCPSCHKPAVIGNTVMEVSTAPHARPPSDLALPRSSPGPGEVDSPIPAEAAPETTIAAGKWHSAQPVTFDMPGHDRPLVERWRDRVTGETWHAVDYAFGTRMLCARSTDPTDRVTVSRREWLASMERID